MSRIGKQPVVIPQGVTVTLSDGVAYAKGPKGEMSQAIHRDIKVDIADNEIVCSIERPSKEATSLWGTTRALLANLVQGVNEGFQKQLELHGVGYRANVKGKNLELALGFSHPVLIEAPENITFVVEKDLITITGIDAQAVGQVAAEIRAVRPPEPYKGKGVRYKDEIVRRKVGKVVGAAS